MGPTTIEPGYKTTEFWLTNLMIIFGFAQLMGWVPKEVPIDKLVGAVVAIGAVIAYIINRAIVKYAAYRDRPPIH